VGPIILASRCIILARNVSFDEISHNDKSPRPFYESDSEDEEEQVEGGEPQQQDEDDDDDKSQTEHHDEEEEHQASENDEN
jgi:hypothetical protein